MPRFSKQREAAGEIARYWETLGRVGSEDRQRRFERVVERRQVPESVDVSVQEIQSQLSKLNDQIAAKQLSQNKLDSVFM